MSQSRRPPLARSLAELTHSTHVRVNSVLLASTWSKGIEVFLERASSVNRVAQRADGGIIHSLF
jgi:hypothetical protein